MSKICFWLVWILPFLLDRHAAGLMMILPRASVTIHHRLCMGGYYNEPERLDEEAAVKTHMVFGTRCLERSISLQQQQHDSWTTTTTTVMILQPIRSSESAQQQQQQQQNDLERESALASFVLQHCLDSILPGSTSVQQQQPTTVAVLEHLGRRRTTTTTGLVSLALLSSSSPRQEHANLVVRACSTDETQLQLLKMSHLFYGVSSSSSSNNRLETVHLKKAKETGHFLLPEADVWIIMKEEKDDDDDVQECVLQMLSDHKMVVILRISKEGTIQRQQQ